MQSAPDSFLDVFGIADGSLQEAAREIIGGLPQEIDPNVLWKELQEGQTYLVGHFDVTGSVESPGAIVINPDANNFLRIDQISIVKDTSELLYSKALTGKGGTDAETNH